MSEKPLPIEIVYNVTLKNLCDFIGNWQLSIVILKLDVYTLWH